MIKQNSGGGGGAVFGKPSRPSLHNNEHGSSSITAGKGSSSSSDGGGVEGNLPTQQKLPNKAEAKIKLIQMEIAEKEACNVLQSLCLDAAMLLPCAEQPAVEVVDLLSGVLLLGNFCKRIGYEKESLEKRMAGLIKDHEEVLKDKKSMIDQLEQVILRLQDENIRLSDQVAELNVKHSQKVAAMSREIFSQREKFEELKAEKVKIETKLQFQERKLMDIPRLEEGYLRQARGYVRQAEMANTMNKIEWKKVEEEAKLCQFWKGKAKALEETTEEMKAEIENLTNQVRMNFTKYQQVSQVLANMKSKGKSFNSLLAKHQTASGLAKQQQQSKQARPTSAPALRKVSSNQTTLGRRPSSSATLFLSIDQEIAATGDSNNRSGSREAWGIATGDSIDPEDLGMRRAASTTAFLGSDLETKLRNEIAKLREQLEEKSQHVLRLSQKLSQARAYPLASVSINATRRSTSGGGPNRSSGRKGWREGLAREEMEEDDDQDSLPDLDTLQAAEKRNALEGYDDLELTIEEEQEEARLQEDRIAKALAIQRDYNDRVKKTRASNPPHIAAIRNSKSFVQDI
eukprot:gene5209-5741_t